METPENPFDQPPLIQFLYRTGVPAVLLGGFLWACLGIFSAVVLDHSRPYDLNGTSGKSLFNEPKTALSLPFWVSSAAHYQETWTQWNSVPEFCKIVEESSTGGHETSAFEKRICDVFWEQVYAGIALALVPFLIPILLVSWATSEFLQVYRKLRRQFRKNEAQFKARVLDPPAARQDLFSRFFCFRPIRIDVGDGSQITAYCLISVSPPSAGSTLAIFKAGKWWGKIRYVGLLYAPHVKVIRGS